MTLRSSRRPPLPLSDRTGWGWGSPLSPEEVEGIPVRAEGPGNAHSSEVPFPRALWIRYSLSPQVKAPQGGIGKPEPGVPAWGGGAVSGEWEWRESGESRGSGREATLGSQNKQRREEPGAQAGHSGPPAGCPDLGGAAGIWSPVPGRICPQPPRVRGRAPSSQSGPPGARSQAVDLRAPRLAPPLPPRGSHRCARRGGAARL